MDELQKEKAEVFIQETELETKEFLDSLTPFFRFALLFMVLTVIPLYFIAKYTTAQIYMSGFTKRQIAVHQPTVATLPVRILDAESINIKGNAYAAYALIKNPNKELTAENLDYTFYFVDAAGNTIDQQSGKSFLLAGQQKYLIIANRKLNKAPAKVRVEIKNPDWKRRLDIPTVVLRTGIPNYHDQTSPDGFAIDGTVQNQSHYNLGSVVVSTVVRDSNNNIIAVTQNVLNAITAGETRAYHLYWPVPIQTLVGSMPEIYAETNVLDSGNIR